LLGSAGDGLDDLGGSRSPEEGLVVDADWVVGRANAEDSVCLVRWRREILGEGIVGRAVVGWRKVD